MRWVPFDGLDGVQEIKSNTFFHRPEILGSAKMMIPAYDMLNASVHYEVRVSKMDLDLGVRFLIDRHSKT